jgi:hypothetical protein
MVIGLEALVRLSDWIGAGVRFPAFGACVGHDVRLIGTESTDARSSPIGGTIRRRRLSTPVVRILKPLAVTAVVLCVAGGAQGGSRAEIQVLATHKGWIDEPVDGVPQFGVNRTRLRWADITPLTSGRSWTLDVSASSRSVTGRWPAGLAFSGGRSAGRSEAGGHNRSNAIGVLKGRRRATIEEFQTPDEGPGGYLAGPHAVGPYIAYGWYETGRAIKGTCDELDFNCDYTIKRGGLRLIEGLRRGRFVTRSPVAAFSLSSTGTVAYVRATRAWHNDWGPSVVEVVTLWSPRVLTRIRAPGKVTALAISDRVLAVRLQTPTHRAVVFFDLWTGRQLRMVRRRSGVGTSLALKGSRAVMLMGSNLVELEVYSGSKRVLKKLRGGVGGLAFAGDKLVWYENRGADDTARYRVMSMS